MQELRHLCVNYWGTGAISLYKGEEKLAMFKEELERLKKSRVSLFKPG